MQEMHKEMLNKFPKISVIISCYNRTEYINHAINSVVSNYSSYIKPEILIVSNLDKKILINNEFLDKIRYIYNEGRTYGVMIREAIKEASSDLIVFLEDDDIFYTNKLKKVLSEFETDNKLAYYHNSAYNIDKDGNYLGVHNSLKERIRYKPFESIIDLRKIMRNSPDNNLSSIAIRREFINTNDLLTMEKIILSIDTYIYAAMLKGDNILIDDNIPLTGYRLHYNNTSDIRYNTRKATRIHDIYSRDYLLASEISDNKYLKRYLVCKSKQEKLYLHNITNEITYKDFLNLLSCLYFVNFGTFENFLKNFEKA